MESPCGFGPVMPDCVRIIRSMEPDQKIRGNEHGREWLACRDRRSARKHLAKSLRHRTFVPSTLLLFAMSHGPSFTYPLARELVRAARGTLRLGKHRKAAK